MGTTSPACRTAACSSVCPVHLLNPLTSGLHLGYKVTEAGVAKVPKDSEARYLMGISITKSTLKAADLTKIQAVGLDDHRTFSILF